MRRYLEEIVTKVIPEQSEELIKEETERIKIFNELRKNQLIEYIFEGYSLNMSVLYTSLVKSNSLEDFVDSIRSHLSEDQKDDFELMIYIDKERAIKLYNQAKELIEK